MEWVDKPDSVPRFSKNHGDDHVSGTHVTVGFWQPTRELRSGRPPPNITISIFIPMGLHMG